MAVIMTPPPTPPGDPAAQAPPTLSVTYYQKLATHFSEVLDEITVIVPRDTALDHSSSFVSTHLNIPLKFLATTVAAVEQFVELQVTKKLDVDRARDTLQMIDAFRPICYKVAAFMEDIGNALDARQAALAVEALEAYHVARSLARDESNPTLTIWVDNMQIDLGRRGPRKKRIPGPDPASPPEVVPVPVPLSTMAAPEKPHGWNS